MTEALGILGLLLALLSGMFFALYQRDELKEEAVKRGFAEWVVSSKGTVKWAWKEVEK